MGKKRTKNFYSYFKSDKRWKGMLSVGMKGFLCTCNMRIKECISEAYNILNDFAERCQMTLEEEVPEKEESVEEELERELKGLRQKPNEKMFQVVETGSQNTVFIKTTLDDPAKLADAIFSEIYESKQNISRYLLRLVPIEVTCKAYIDDVKKAADRMFDEPFKCDPLTFNVYYKARYNSSLLRDEVLSSLVTLVRDRNPLHKVDLTTPKKTIVVEVVKGVCCLSVITDFYKHRKYNLSEAAKVGEPEAVSGAAEEDADNKAEKVNDSVETPQNGSAEPKSEPIVEESTEPVT